MQNALKTIVISACFALLTACGGGGGSSTTDSSSSTTDSSSSSTDSSSSSTDSSSSSTDSSSSTTDSSSSSSAGITVVPALGAFGPGANIALFDAATGDPIGTPTTTLADGTAIINLGNHTTSFVIKVTGAATGVSYFDEGAQPSAIDRPLLASHTLLAMVPTSVAVSANARIGVTPLTHMAAAFAGLSSSNLKVQPQTTTESVPFTIAKAYARVRYAFGLGTVHTSLEAYLNPLLAPKVLSASTLPVGIDLSAQGGYYGLLLAEMAYAGALSNPTYTPIQYAQALASEATTLVANQYSNTAITAFTQSAPRLVMATATNAVGSGTSVGGYINTCINPTSDAAPRMKTTMAAARNQTDLSTNPDQLAQTILTQTQQQLSGISVNMTFTRSTASGCT